MRRWIAAAALLATADARAQTALTAPQVAAQVYASYAAVTTFEAGLTETLTVFHKGTSSTTRIRTGRVRAARGGKIRFDATNGDVIFSDGSFVYVYETAKNTAWRMAARKSAVVAALAFLEGDLTKRFTLSLSNLTKPSPTTAFVLMGHPNVRSPQVEFAAFSVTPSMQIHRAAIIDDKGDQTSFDLASPTLNATLSPATFHWVPPPGAKVINI